MERGLGRGAGNLLCVDMCFFSQGVLWGVGELWVFCDSGGMHILTAYRTA